MTDDDIVTIFYPIGTATPNQRLIAISTGRSVAAKALREAAEWMDQNGVCMGALCCRALADRTLNGEVTAPAALAQPLEAQADARWQPIETAPKFGEPIDVWGRYGRKTECVFGKPTYAGGLQWIYEASYDSNGPVFEIVVDPTHWMAAPAAPAATNDTEKQS